MPSFPLPLGRFLDFVIWGHEHESLPEPVHSALIGCEITQPGSSVATSLTEGESRKKHALLLEVRPRLESSDQERQRVTECGHLPLGGGVPQEARAAAR
eukprot:1192099-Prorocentrum_minimum.AAC.7